MKTAARILWVDDAIDKRGAAPGAILGLMQRTNGVKAFGCHPWSLASKIGGTPGYDLFLVDFRLSKEPYQNRGRYPYTGISVGGLIRDECPEYPIYLTSALLTEQSDIVLDSELFDRVVTLQSLTTRPGIELLKNDALDYHKIRNAKHRGSIRSVHRLLRSPTSTHTEIVQALPEELRHGLGARQHTRAAISQISPGTIRFGRWVTYVLMVNPGLLYDDLYAATYLGATLSYFLDRLKKHFIKHQYAGVFSQTHERRWWKSGLTEQVVAHPRARESGTIRVWELAPDIYGVPKRSRPKCEVCGKPLPETVAYDKDNPSRRGPAHLSCSEPDPSRKPILYFEPFRVFVE